MNACIELGIIVLLALILLVRPKLLCNCSKSILGRVVFIMIILFLGYHNIIYGLIGVMLYIILNNEDEDEDVVDLNIEIDDMRDHDDYIENNFIKNDCIVGIPEDTPLIKKNNNTVKFPQDLEENNIEKNKFEIIINEEIMRPMDSKDLLVDLSFKKMGGDVVPVNN